MSLDVFLSRLDKVRRTGLRNGIQNWTACCPVHDDKSPSLSVGERGDGGVVINCFGCGAKGPEVCDALGIDPSELFPPAVRDDMRRPRERRPFSADDALRLVECEIRTAATLILVSTTEELTAEQRTELASCSATIAQALRACGLRGI